MNSPCLFLRRLGVDDLITGKATMREIACQVAERYDLTLADFKGSSSAYRIAHPRQEAMALIRTEGRFSYLQIGRFFNRDHTTVLHGVRAHSARRTAAMGIAAE